LAALSPLVSALPFATRRRIVEQLECQPSLLRTDNVTMLALALRGACPRTIRSAIAALKDGCSLCDLELSSSSEEEADAATIVKEEVKSEVASDVDEEMVSCGVVEPRSENPKARSLSRSRSRSPSLGDFGDDAPSPSQEFE
jgi:hypothetical protein